MPSRMERYYKTSSNTETDVKRRTNKNQQLYRRIYEEGEYTNVEGISIIEKNEKIDIDKIRELIGSREESRKPKEKEIPRYEPEIIEEEEEVKNYDIREVLDKAKSERTEKEPSFGNTQYNILKNIQLSDDIGAPKSMSDDDLKDMIEAITVNSKTGFTGDLLDDLKSIHDPNLKTMIDQQALQEKPEEMEIDRSFYTSSLGFTSDDFDDLKEMKDSLKTNNILTKILLFVLLVVIVTGAMFLIYHFTR